jgi:hypothetical protein
MEVLRDRTSEAGHDAVYSVLPRPFAWVMRFEHPAIWLGAATGAGYLLVTAAILAAAGPVAVGLVTGVSWADVLAVHVTYALYFAGVPIAIAILVRGLERDARNLAPALGAKEGGDASLYRDALKVAPRAVWLGAGAGLLVAIATIWVMAGSLKEVPRVGVLFITLREIAIDLALFGAMGWGVGAALRLSRLTEERARPDLLAPRAFAPLARNGTRLAAVWLVFMAISIPVGMVPPEVLAEVMRSLLVMVFALAALALVALILPCRGAHRVLRAAKRAELREVRSQIAEARRTREDTRLPGLLAWEARIEGLSEWPIDATALRRTGLFLMLPVASWVGSAFVERLVDASIG